MWDYMQQYHGTWGFGFMGVGMLLFWGLAIFIAVALAASLFRTLRGEGGGAAEILKQRYARGEIGKEEYDTRRRDLAAR